MKRKMHITLQNRIFQRNGMHVENKIKMNELRNFLATNTKVFFFSVEKIETHSQHIKRKMKLSQKTSMLIFIK